MSKPALGIDLGTSSIKICLLDEQGLTIGVATQRYPTHSPHERWMEQDPQDWLTAFTKAMAELAGLHAKSLASLGSICLTSAAHIGVLLDAEDRPLRRALLWSDQRSTDQVKELLQAEDEIYAISANKPSPSWTLPHFLWVKEREPELYAQVRRVCFSKDYLLHWLTGLWVTDPATAVSSMLYDCKEHAWSSRLLSYLDMTPNQLPRIMDSCSVVGTLLPEMATLLGLPNGVAVVNGSLDSATETYGSGARKAGDVVIRIGTAGGIHKLSEKPMQIRSLLTYPFPLDALWYSQAGTNAAGSAIGWATEQQGFSLDETGFAQFDELAARAPAGCEGLLFHPYLNGERTPYWNASLRGTYSGLSFLHKRSHMARSVLEGVCFSLKDALLALMKEDEIPPHIMVVGGGAKDRLLMEILSSVLNTTLLLAPGIDSAYGCARIGQLSLNDPTSLAMLDTVQSSSVVPCKEWVEVYAHAFVQYAKRSDTLVGMYS